ncbi:UNVERIFIED_CONTAM: hypothetical protein GTU68_046289, partial [Idotea baltica]|nr:hypothetical protein [Idotea baltica]
HVWDNCLRTIQDQINEKSFKTWFVPIRAVSIHENVLTVQVPNRFFYEFVEEHFMHVLKRAIKKELGDGSERKVVKTSRQSHVEQVAMVKEEIRNPFVIPGIKKIKIDPQLNRRYRFDNYIQGDCNKLARSAGIAITENPGKTAFNPLFIFGDVGLGKTHLAQAIGNEVLDSFPGKVVLYVTSDKFTNQIIQAIKNNAVNDFVNFYQLVDVLIIDDIQFLANRVKTQEIFFHIFNQLHQRGNQIILTSDRPPKDLEGMEERLISRFKWGLSADLNVPEFETRMAILQSKMSSEGVDLPNDVVEFICYNIKNNIRELEGVLISLIAQSSLNQREIDIDLARDVIENFVNNITKEITVNNIQYLVAEYFNVPLDKLQGKTRKRSIVLARQLCMYLAKTMTKQSLKSIGETFGGRDHSTVIYSINAVRDLLDTDNDTKDIVKELEKKIKMSLTVPS